MCGHRALCHAADGAPSPLSVLEKSSDSARRETGMVDTRSVMQVKIPSGGIVPYVDGRGQVYRARLRVRRAPRQIELHDIRRHKPVD